jgi:hypothetical protein
MRFLKVDDVDAVSGHKDEFFHLWVPTAGQVTKMGA